MRPQVFIILLPLEWAEDCYPHRVFCAYAVPANIEDVHEWARARLTEDGFTLLDYDEAEWAGTFTAEVDSDHGQFQYEILDLK